MFNKEKFKEELKGTGIKYNPSGFKLGFLVRLLMRIKPKLGIKLLNKRLGVENDVFDQADELFSKIERIEIFPSGGGRRSFILVLNQKTALFFYQDGDHFKYDGYETGEYAQGDVTIFDKLPEDSRGPYDFNSREY